MMKKLNMKNNLTDQKNYNSDEEISSNDKYSTGSYEEVSKYNQEHSKDKPRTYTNSTQNNNSREFKSNNGFELTKSRREQEENHTLELSPDAA